MAAKRRCVIISASPDYNAEYIRSCIHPDDYIICADGGIDIVSKINITPDLIVGDFDSASRSDLFPEIETIRLKTRKIDTDTMHCTDVALDRGFSDFLYLGATGGRTDHALANLSVLLYLSGKGAKGVISDSFNDIMLLGDGDNHYKMKIGTTVSVIPFGSNGAELSYRGLSYPLDHGKVTVDYPYTISNEAVNEDVTITLHTGSALVIIVKQ